MFVILPLSVSKYHAIGGGGFNTVKTLNFETGWVNDPPPAPMVAPPWSQVGLPVQPARQ